MPLSAELRELLISGFRAEISDHVQVMTDGLLALEQHPAAGEERRAVLESIFRGAHNLKGAARSIGITTIEQLAHALEDPVAMMQRGECEPSPELFTACHRVLDAIQALQPTCTPEDNTLPEVALQALAALEPYRQAPPPAASAAPLDAESPGPASQGAAPEPASLPVQETPAAPERGVPALGYGQGAAEQGPRSTDEGPRAPDGGPRISDETIRVSVAKLDTLMAQLGELLVAKIRAEQRKTQVRQAQELVAQWQREWLAVRGDYGRLARLQQGYSVDALHRAQAQSGGGAAAKPVDGRNRKELARLLHYVETSQERLREANALINSLAREHDQDTMSLAMAIDAIEREIKRVRLLPLGTITAPFGRMVRSLAQAAGKEAVLQIQGNEVELDRRVLEQIKDPLIHLLRNAIDHGVEGPLERLAAGKPRSGLITLVAEQLGKDVVLCISDDGAGLDLDAIRRVAARRGLIEGDGSSIGESDLADLIFRSGFSTSPLITDVSGRGVGLDVVRRNVEALGGRLGVSWQAGAGATFTLALPQTLASSRGLIVGAAGQRFAIPLAAVERILSVVAESIVPLGGHDALQFNGRPIPLVRLDDVLELPHAPKAPGGNGATSSPVVVLTAGQRQVAFAVDELAGEQEVVIKGLGKQLSRVGGIAGATVMGDGNVVLILNAADLIKLALRESVAHRAVFTPQEEAGGPAARARRRILIVDDSITTRTLEKNILEAAGYTVCLAIDGQEALDALVAEPPDLVISDIAMPRLDGFGLTRRIKGDARTADLPVILVTSLDSPADKARGIEVGADAYIVKSHFDQSNLLDAIQQLL